MSERALPTARVHARYIAMAESEHNKENLFSNKQASDENKAADSERKEDDYGYSLYPGRTRSKYKEGSIGESLFTFKHKCHIMLQVTLDTSKTTSHLCVVL